MKGKERLSGSTQSGYTGIMHSQEQIKSALKLQELLKKRIKYLNGFKEIVDLSDEYTTLQSLVEESEK